MLKIIKYTQIRYVRILRYKKLKLEKHGVKNKTYSLVSSETQICEIEDLKLLCERKMNKKMTNDS